MSIVITFKCGSVYASGIRDILNLFPAQDKRIMDTLDGAMGGVTSLPGYTCLSNLFTLFMVAEEYNTPNDYILEIGTNRGKSSYTMALAAPQSHIITVDIDKGNCAVAREIHKSGSYLGGVYNAGIQSKKTNVEVVCSFSGEYLKSYKGPQFSMIFIDGDHGDGVLTDAYWWNHLRVGGCILFHDYHGLYPRVVETVDRLAAQLGREAEIQLHTDSCLMGFYRQAGDGPWV